MSALPSPPAFSRPVPPDARALGADHFAFLRGLYNGLDPQELWNRYLDVEGAFQDARLVNRTIRWLRKEMEILCLRMGKPGQARLLRLRISRPSQMQSGECEPEVESLEDFAISHGLEDASEQEQIAAYREYYGSQSQKKQDHAARLIKRQLALLHALQDQCAQSPTLSDPVAAWFPERTRIHLQAAGIQTLFGLVERVRRNPDRWWASIRGIGKTKAQRIDRWLQSSGLSIPPSRGILLQRPLDDLGSPAESNGMDGDPVSASGMDFRVRLSTGEILTGIGGATSDQEAVAQWLGGVSGHTLRAYSREIERFMLWAHHTLRKRLSEITTADLSNYVAFLRDPQPADVWCGPRGARRGSAQWRPFEGPLSESAVLQSVQIIGSCLASLVAQGHLRANAAAALRLPRQNVLREQFGRRRLTPVQWAWVRSVESFGANPLRQRRIQLILQTLHATGLRVSELAAVRMSHLESLEDADGVQGLLMHILGKGGKVRDVPVPVSLHAAALALARDIMAECAVDDCASAPESGATAGSAAWIVQLAHDIGSQGGKVGHPLSTAGIEKEIKTHMRRVAREVERAASALRNGEPAQACIPESVLAVAKPTDLTAERLEQDAARIARASAHWLRHGHASQALAQGVDLVTVQQNLGHASLATTSRYVSAEQRRRMRQMRAFWDAEEQMD